MTIVDEIKERIRLQDLIAENPAIRLRKSGSSYVGLCPFHNNKNTPSFVVWEGTQTWKCFGSCNEGGDVFTYVMKQNPTWDFKEAMKHLAGRVGIVLRADDSDLNGRISARVNANVKKIAQDLFKKWLLGERDKERNVTREPDKEALAYAIDRGWTLETLKGEGIGFSGRATTAAFNEMRETFKMWGIDPLAPEAVMILGFKGNVKEWAEKYGLDPNSFGENSIQGFMDTPSLMFAHKFDGVIEYLSARFLPEWEEKRGRKSHNPNSILAGPRKPYFNRLHKWHHADGKQKGKRIHIVEGQGDAAAFGQLGEPAIALCGSSWRHLIESGIIDLLKKEYEDICFTIDADKPGEKVVTGENSDFPLTTAFGAMLWVERVPKFNWSRPNSVEKKVKDVSDLTQYFHDLFIEVEQQKEEVKKIISSALPIVVEAAGYVGKQEGSLKEDAIQKLAKPLILSMPTTTRLNYSALLAEKIYPNIKSKTERTILFNKWLGSELKALRDEDDEDELETIQTLGGWYPDEESENSGYLLDIIYDKKVKRIRFAYAHIKDMKNGEREVGIANFLIIGDKKYEPPEFDEIIESGVLKLASGLGELKNSSELIKKNAEYYEKYFYLEEKSRYRFCGAYALFSWVYDSFEALNFLRARGGSGSGKSDLMYLVGLTSYRFAVTLSTSSTASYKGMAKLYNAAMMIDEADNLMKKDDGTMEAFLKGRSMKRYSNSLNMMEVMTDNGKTFVPSTSIVYGILFITMYHSFKDPGIENRCITFDLSQVDTLTLAQAGMEPGYYPPELEDDAEHIRNLGLRWRLENWMPKIELSEAQRKEAKLFDPLVSPRVNQVLRPMKVLAVMQNDFDLLEDLKMIGRANYEDEMIKRAGSFEALILRAILAADIASDLKTKTAPSASAEYAEKVKGYAEKVEIGKLGRHGTVKYILYKDVAEIANQIMDAENAANEDEKKKNGVKGRTIGEISRESFRLPVERTGKGWVVVLDRDRLDIAKLRFGLDREADYQKPAESEKQVTLPAVHGAGDEIGDWVYEE